MGINAANVVQTPPAGDAANAVVQGSLTAVGVSLPFSVYGLFNVSLGGFVTTALTTTQGSNAASVASGTGIAPGQSVNSVNVPAGTTWLTFSGTSGTLAFPPGSTSANVVTGTDNNATFSSIAVAATVQLERSFDGGKSWFICSQGLAGAAVAFTNVVSASIVPYEPERGVVYRLNVTAYTSGTIGYRFSTTGGAATSWAAGAP